MKTYTEEEVMQMTNVPGGTWEHDNHGQVVIYTGIFEWSNHTFHDRPEPDLEDDPTDA